MAFKNTENAYGVIARVIHWTTALLILGLLCMGYFMDGMSPGPDKIKLFGLHKSFGILVLMLAATRVLWRVISPAPKSLSTHAVWEKGLSHLAHLLLYIAIFAMPLSGWVMSSAGDFPNSFFGLFEMPDIVAKNEELFRSSRFAHGTIALVLLAVVALHMAGAFKHHFIDRDETLRRMSSRSLGFGGGAMFVLLFGGLWLLAAGQYAWHELNEEEERQRPPVAQPVTAQQDAAASDLSEAATEAPQGVPQWTILPDDSALTFEVTQYGQPFSGRFETFGGEIFFDPAQLEKSRVRIHIDIASIKTGSDDRDEQARSDSWFASSSFPQAVFEAVRFTPDGDDRYIAHGTLTLRETVREIDLPFSLHIAEDENGGRRADMEAQLALNRLDFGVGQGEWADTNAIGDNVSISIKVRAQATLSERKPE